jgi:PAS domain S-box-containing protein
MTFWKLTRWLFAIVWSGCLAATDGEPASGGQPRPVWVVGTLLDAGSGGRLWLGLAAAALVAAGVMVWWRRRAGGTAGSIGKDSLFTEERHRQLFDHTPVQILVEDLTAIEELFSQLRAEGVSNMIAHLAAHPDLPREWLNRVRLIDANRPAVVAAGFTNRQEMVARFPQHAAAPYLEVFRYQLESLWAGRRLFQEEFHYRDAGGHERAGLMQCRAEERENQPDLSRVVLVLMDITTAKRTASAQMENQDLVRQILARADILLWWAQVRRENGQMRWKINVPPQVSETPLLQLATARDRGGLWDAALVPEYDVIAARAVQAILSGSPSYQNEFCVFSAAGATHWVNENVGISRLGPDEWSLVGLVMDVTALHQAEEERRKNQAQLKQILTRADCMVWQSRVTESSGEFAWEFEIPHSGLEKRIFGGDTSVVHKGVSGIKARSLYGNFIVAEQTEMDARALGALRNGAPGYEQEFSLIKGDQKLWLHERVSVTSLRPGQWDLVGITVDVTPQHQAEEARRMSQAQLQQILTRADCLLWHASVRREGAGLQWRDFAMPSSVLCDRLFGANPPATGTGLWYDTDIRDLAEMNRRSTQAILTGAPSYEQEFPVVRPTQTLWLHEQVSITPVGADQWDLVGVLMDVTARHEAEEARRASEARLQQILDRADCMLWQAHVTEVDGKMSWRFDVPASGLQRRIFGCEGLSGSPVLYENENFKVPELSEMHVLGATALRSGAPGYEHEFRIVKPDHTYWLRERGTITPEGPGRWLVFGLVIDLSALKEAEQVIRASEARYRDLFEGAVEGVFQSTPEGRFISVNPSLARIFGCATPADFLAWTENGAKSLYVSASRREEFFFELGERDSVTDFQSEVRCRDGGVKWISENVRAVRSAGGRLLHLQGFLTDVTERRKAMMTIQESESRYRALFEKIPVAIFELDLSGLGRILQRWHADGVRDLTAHLADHPGEFAALAAGVEVAAVNETAVRLTKAESKAHLQGEIAQLFNTQGFGVLQRWLESIWQGHNDGEAEAELGDFVGGCHHTYLRWWMPRQAEWLRLEHAVVALVDLTELNRAEAALAAEKERLTVTLRAMAEGVVTTDTRGIIQFMNRAAEELTQCDAAKAIGRPIAEICLLRGPRAEDTFVLPLTQVLEDRALVDLPPETWLVGRNGATCLVEGCCAPVHDAESQVVGTVLVIRDITVRQRFEQELERASRLESIGILAGGIAHDFNNILTAIMGNITLALLDAGGLATVERYLQEAERATLRARDLTQQLLTFAKGGDPVRSAVLLPEIIREVAEFALHGSRVKCEFDLPAGLWPANADQGQLGQVVQNLVINAVQAMPEGGSIRISAVNETVGLETKRPFHPGDYVHISVADSGTGVKPEHLVRIFDPYFTTKQHGSGLGLTTVYSIIRKHQGHIEVESELGHGTTFHFWLPALREEEPEREEVPGEAVAPLKGRVLFMDDEEPIVAMASLLLRRMGMEVELARDGAEAVQKFSEAHTAGRPFDLVVMDLTVPGGIGGREAIEQLRQIDPNVRAIVSSGYSSDPVLANHRAYGFCGMVAKPYKVEDFARVLRAALRQSRSPFFNVTPPPPAAR